MRPAGIAWIDEPGATAWGECEDGGGEQDPGDRAAFRALSCGPADHGADGRADADPAGPGADAAQAGGGPDAPAPLPPGRWGDPRELALPLADRGLLLADGLFETLWLEDGRPQLLEAHLQRWRRSAALLGLAAPPSAGQLRPLIAAACRRSGLQRGALRLNWSRGQADGARGIDLPAPGEATAPHRFWFQLRRAEPLFTPVSVLISERERRNPASLLSRCKSFAYGSAVQARREARQAGADEALLLDTAGRLSCGSCANLLLRLDGQWLTPDLGSGCLPGVMRRRGLEQGLLQEAQLLPADLQRAEAALLLNSLSCRPIRQWGSRRWPADALDWPHQPEPLWRGLLQQPEAA
ncbi:MAG: aminotransferase class IV [Synechococcaceae cyanobacterium]|nr:aminotransferase class IV [Synechococcaceae cyanobacterium]